jgi:tetratricopeptide (TPR) repeat protein
VTVPPGSRLGAYEILSLQGAGGMGDVYKARDTRLGRIVAIKVIGAASAEDPAMHARFEREARAISSLDHPNICALYDVGEEAGLRYLVMQYLEGIALSTRLKQDPLPLAEAVRYAIDIARALDAAHVRGIVHRDLKPGNVMLTATGARLLDFGLAIARWTAPPTSSATIGDTPTFNAVTGSGHLIGTPQYMAPEQIEGSRGDARSDLFSFGAVLYEMLTGRRAFGGDGRGVLTSILTVDPPPPSSIVPGIPATLDRVVERSLAKDPEARWQTAAEMLAQLEGAVTVSTTIPARGIRPVAAAVAAAVAAVAILAAGGGAYWWSTRNQPASGEPTTLAVLPLEMPSADPAERAYWAGLTNAITAKLSSLPAARHLHVASAADVTARAVQTPMDARVELGATRVVRGTAMDREGAVSATLELVDAVSGRQLEMATVALDRNNPASTQDRLVEAVISLLGLTLTERERAPLRASQPAAGGYDFYLQGLGYLQTDRPESLEAAITVFQHALEVDPNYALAHAGLGEAHWRRYLATRDVKWADIARQTCERALGLDEAEAAPHACLGTVANGVGQYDKGVEEFEHALARQPDSEAAYIGLAGAYQGLGQNDKAEEIFRRAIAVRPGYWLGYSRLGAFYYSQARYPESEEMFKQVVALSPDSWRGYSNLGALYYVQGRTKEAISAFERSLAIRSNSLAASNLGSLYFYEQQDYEKAAEAFRRAIALSGEEYVLWGNYAMALEWSGQNEAARKAYQRAAALAEASLRVNAKEASVQMSLAEYYAALGDRSRATTLMRGALALEPDNPRLHYQAAVLEEHHLGNREDALKWLRSAIEKGYSRQQIARSPSLAALREDPRFQDLQ